MVQRSGGRRFGGRARAAAAAGGVVVVSAAAITAGVLWGAGGPATAAGPDDAYATAPGCDAVGADLLASVAPSAALEAAERGPLADASGSSCVWTSLGGADGASAPDTAPRSVQVAFHAHFTDKAGEVTGEQAAAARLAELAPVNELNGSAPVAGLGPDALVWHSPTDPGAAELAFRRGNLVVRVWYGGADLTFDDARAGAVAVAEGVAAAV
ncbi:hypothetical protein [Marinitenerispora sediminis]|uniref:hypothetical protein n=1 Tax=Marinitenerispora sediminis TaxID=1931232 RepID=UPI0015F1A1F6|nr:hypothetical protein [Marinitenerispora sediminis]